MKDMFAQGGKGSTGILTNKQAIARVFNVKANLVNYLDLKSPVDSYSILYDKTTQTAWFNKAAKGIPQSWTIDTGIMTLLTSSGSYTLKQAISVTNQHLNDVDGATLFPDLQMSRWGDLGDIRAWGADPSKDSATALQAAVTAKGNAYIPVGTFSSTEDPAAEGLMFSGLGRVIGPDNKKRGKYFSSVTKAPASLGDESSVLTAFNGDNSKSHFQIEHRITGADTLGKPTTGYTYQPESMPNYTYLYNESGWNESLTGNGGRTGIAAYRAKVDQYGQGDAVAFNASVFVTGAKAGATHFLAMPAGVGFNLDMSAGSNGVYFNPYELVLHDNGFDVAAVGFVANFNRSKDAGIMSSVWHGARYQSVGVKACDTVISASGKWKTGIDFSQSTTDFGTNQAAISLRGGQRIYLNNAANASGNLEAGWHTTVFNGDYIAYNTDKINIVAGGNPNLQVSANRVTIASQLNIVGANNTDNSATAGGGATLPATVAFFLRLLVDGTVYRLPLYK